LAHIKVYLLYWGVDEDLTKQSGYLLIWDVIMGQIDIY
jgi:hypothetical protein